MALVELDMRKGTKSRGQYITGLINKETGHGS